VLFKEQCLIIMDIGLGTVKARTLSFHASMDSRVENNVLPIFKSAPSWLPPVPPKFLWSLISILQFQIRAAAIDAGSSLPVHCALVRSKVAVAILISTRHVTYHCPLIVDMLNNQSNQIVVGSDE
jgi:hypothetical protein